MYFYCIIFIGWTDIIRDGTLCIYKLGFFETGPEVVISVTIQEDFSWHLLYRKHQVDKDSCSILRDVPSEINTGRWM